jgi:hypothetical protein
MSQYDIPDFIKKTNIKDLLLIDNRNDNDKEKRKEIKKHSIFIITESDIINQNADPFYVKGDKLPLSNKTTYSYIIKDIDHQELKVEDEELEDGGDDDEDGDECDPELINIYKVMAETLTFLQTSKPMPSEKYESYVNKRNKFEKYKRPILKKSRDIYETIQITLQTIDNFIKSKTET